MKAFRRPPEPYFWKEQEIKIYKSIELKKRITRFYPKEVKYLLFDATHGHCSYCDVKLDHFNSEINNFLPKSKFPKIAYDWNNLYLCCRTCNRYKSAKFSEYILRPDDINYSFEKYFICDFKAGKILPNPNISIYEQEKAKITIDILNLNRTNLLKSRLMEFKRFKEILYVAKSNSDLKGEQFDFSKYGDILDIDKYSYRFFLKQVFSEINVEKSLTNTKKFYQIDKELKRIRIKSLKIKNIKGFSNTTINFNPQNKTNLILGINGRGKTTILQLIAVALQQLNSKILNKRWTDIVKKGETEGFSSLQFDNPNNLELSIKIKKNDDIDFISGTDNYKKIKNDLLILAYGSYRRATEKYEDEVDNYQCVSSLFGENYLKNIKTPGVSNYLRSNFSIVKNLINKIFQSADNTSQVLLDSFDDYNFYFTTPTNKKLKITFDALAEGYKSVFVWLIDMVMRIVERGYTIYSTEKINGIVMIDEIDLHLHPAWQRTLMPILNSIFPNIQFIISSHSPFVIQSLSISDVIMLVLSKNQIKTKRIKKDGKFNAYKIDEIIDKIISAETGDLELNDWLIEKLDLLEEAVEINNKANIKTTVKELRQNLPKESGFHDYINILTAGLI